MAIEPVTREERFLAAAGGQSVTPPTPITRKEQLLQGIIDAVKSGSATPDVIEGAVNDYLNANPVQPGATTEQAAQIEQNKNDIADLQTEVDELKESGGNGSGGNADQNGGSKWRGKTLNFMGDSITEGYASTAKFTDIIASALSAICNNYGIGGSTVANGQSPMYSRVLKMDEDADLCIVFGGTNDFANYDRVLGEQFITSEGRRTLNVDTNTFYGGLNQLCTNLYSRFPYSTLVLCTPINRRSFAGQETGMQANGNGLYLDQYVEAIKKVAAYFGIPCLDLYATANLHPYDAANIAKYYSATDQLHPNAEGHKHLANVMLAFFDTLADKRGLVAEDETEVTLTSISAAYSGGSVAVGTSISALNGIVVTAHYSNGTTETVTGYTLSGEIAVGENTITVSYGGFTTTFVVIGVETGIIEYSVSNMSGVLEVKYGAYDLDGNWNNNPYLGDHYQSWKIPCNAGDEFTQYSNTKFGMYKTYWDVDGNFISSDTPAGGSPTTFTVPDNVNIAYMWAVIQQKDIDDGSYKLICRPSTI